MWIHEELAVWTSYTDQVLISHANDYHTVLAVLNTLANSHDSCWCLGGCNEDSSTLSLHHQTALLFVVNMRPLAVKITSHPWTSVTSISTNWGVLFSWSNFWDLSVGSCLWWFRPVTIRNSCCAIYCHWYFLRLVKWLLFWDV